MRLYRVIKATFYIFSISFLCSCGDDEIEIDSVRGSYSVDFGDLSRFAKVTIKYTSDNKPFEYVVPNDKSTFLAEDVIATFEQLYGHMHIGIYLYLDSNPDAVIDDNENYSLKYNTIYDFRGYNEGVLVKDAKFFVFDRNELTVTGSELKKFIQTHDSESGPFYFTSYVITPSGKMYLAIPDA